MTCREWRFAAVLITGIGVSGASLLADTHSARIVIQVVNHAGVEADLLERAKTEVVTIFRHAGVAIEWSVSPALGSADRVAILIVNGQCSAREVRACRHDVLGIAAPELGQAFVYFNRLNAVSLQRPIDVSVGLAHVIAHEIGHLLLPPHAHSTIGVMRPGIDFTRLSPMRFSTAEAASIRGALTADGPHTTRRHQ
jgi:hypothetical protein